MRMNPSEALDANGVVVRLVVESRPADSGSDLDLPVDQAPASLADRCRAKRKPTDLNAVLMRP